MHVAVSPFILHPSMPADIWCPLLPDGGQGDTGAGIYCGLVYVPSAGGNKGADVSLSKGQPNGTSPVINSIDDVADPEHAAASRRAYNGMVHVQVISARGLPASSKDPQVGVRLRVADHCGGPLPPFQRTAVVRGGGGEPQFDSTFLLGLQQRNPGMDEQPGGRTLGRTPVLEVEARCSRGRGKVLGTVHIPMFPLWFMGHMTRAWYPMRSSDGEAEAGTVFIGLQFIADGKSEEACDMTMVPANIGGTGKVARRRYLFLEVRQARDVRHVRATSGDPPVCPAVHLELLGSGAKGKTPPARDGGADPHWPDGAGLIALPYNPPRGEEGRGSGGSSEVLRITLVNTQGASSSRQEGNARENEGRTSAETDRNSAAGQCDWPLPAEDLASGRPTSSWHKLWVEGTPAGELHLRCRAGFEGEALDQPPPLELNLGKPEGSSPVSRLTFGNYHVEFLEVRGFERTLRRMGLTSEESSTGPVKKSGGLPWAGMAYLAESPGLGGHDGAAYGAASARVASSRAVAVAARGRGGSRSLCVHVSIVGGLSSNVGGNTRGKLLKAVSCVQPHKLVPIAEVPGTELLEWFPCVAVQEGKGAGEGEDRDADTGQVLLSIRYAPLAVGILEVAVCEAQLTGSDQSQSFGQGNLKALSRLLPPQTGALMGHRVRSTPGRQEARTITHDGRDDNNYASRVSVVSWDDACPHRMRFNNAFNNQPTSLHVVVVQRDRMIGFASVGVEAIVHDGMSAMMRGISDGHRKPRGSAHDLGPVGCRDEDFGDAVQAWYPLHAQPGPASLSAERGEKELSMNELSPIARTEVGRIRLRIKFAPHPKVLVRNWQEGAAVTRADGIAAMKAIFYRLNRSGSLVVESEDLRMALVDAVDAFLTNSYASSPTQRAAKSAAGGAPRAPHAGEFVLLMSEGFQSNDGPGRGVPVAESAADSILSMVERDRTAEVTFAEFCAFLSKAAARQAETAVGDLVRELAEDNDDEGGEDDDSEDHDIGSNAERNGGGSLEGQDERRKRLPASRDSSSVVMVDRLPREQIYLTSGSHGEPRQTDKLGKATRVEDESLHAKRALPHFSLSPRSVMSPFPASGEPYNGEVMMHSKSHQLTIGDKPVNARIGQESHHTSFVMPAKRAGTRPAERKPFPADVTSWTVAQVLTWLSEDMQLPKYVHNFREASVDGLVLCDLTDDLLKEGLRMSDPLHRLKVLRNVQKLRRQRLHHKAKKDKAGSYVYAPGWNGVEVTEAASLPDNGPRPQQGGKPQQLLAATFSEGETPIKPMCPSPKGDTAVVDVPARHVGKPLARRLIVEENDHRHAAPRLDLMTDENAFANTMDEIRGELGFLELLAKPSTTGSPLAKRTRQLPVNATTGEVYEVVQTAMWEAAALLEEQGSTRTGRYGGNHERDDFPPSWWGSSEGGSTDRSDRTYHHGESENASIGGSDIGQTGQRARRHARLLFDELCYCQEGGATRPIRPEGGSKLTRHRLEVGIRFLLRIEMRWEQWQMFLDSVPSLRTQGYLSLDSFCKAFAFDSLLPRRVTPRTPSSQGDQPEVSDDSIDFDADSLTSGVPAGETTAKQDVVELRDFVLGMADSLRTCSQTLGFVISNCAARGTRKVSEPGAAVVICGHLCCSVRHAAAGFRPPLYRDQLDTLTRLVKSQCLLAKNILLLPKRN